MNEDRVGEDSHGTRSPADETGDGNIEEIVGELDELSAEIDSSEASETLDDLDGLLAEVYGRGLIDSGVRHLKPSDAVEAFVGSVIFAAPLLVEDGIFDIADHLLGVTAAGVPVFLLVNTLFVVFMTYALVEWTGRERTERTVLFGVVPARVVMILIVSFVVATALMTVWGRVGDWSAPTEALARVSVLWTVGSLGAALGDILSESSTGRDENDRSGDGLFENVTVGSGIGEQSDSELITTLHDRFDDLETIVEDSQTRRQVAQLGLQTQDAALGTRFGQRIRKYTTRDLAEAFVGSIFFSIPLLVEDGVFDVAAHFLSLRVGQFPIFLLANVAFVLGMVGLLVYWAGPQDVQVSRPLLGVVPRRLVGISVVSFLTAAALMTVWGRVGNWQDPVVAIARISVVWAVASFGAALGDILPGESSGTDLNDDLAGVGDRIEELVGYGDGPSRPK